MLKKLLITVVVPVVFVLIWSTGWTVVLFVLPRADPLTFLSLRFVLAGVVIWAFAWAGGAPFPRDLRFVARAVGSGVFLHGLYLCGVWWAVANGVPAGLSALIAALQPLMTAVAAPYLIGERMSRIRIAGVIMGFVGILIALEPKLASIDPGNLWLVLGPIVVNILAMMSLTGGTFYQKGALQGGDLRIIVGLQYIGAFLVTLPLAYALEPMHIQWTIETVLAMSWNVLGLSVGGIALLLFLIRRGEVSRAATLIYLVPPTAAIQVWLVTGTVMTPIQLAGMAVTVAGVALASQS